MAEGVKTVNLKPREPEKQAQLYYADGSPIAPGDVADVVARGEAFSAGDEARVNVDGESATVPTSGLANFLAQRGATVETTRQAKERTLRQEAGSLSGMAKTAGEGLARGVTMGFLGPEQFYDEEGRAAALARMRANPKIAGGSELVGTLGAALAASALSGGAGAGVAAESVAARLAALSARGALTPFRAAAALGEAAEVGAGALGLGRAVSLGARGAAEGALMGVGHEVSQAALEDVPLTAERLLAGAWDGTKMGGAFGLGLGVLGAGVGKAGRAIVGRMAESGDDLGKATGTWAERAAFKQQVGNQGKFFDQATKFGRDEAGPARIGRKLLDANLSTKDTEALRQAVALREEALARMQSVVGAVDDAGVTARPAEVLARIDDQIAKLRETPFGDAQALAKRMEDQIAPFRARYTAGASAADDLDKLGVRNFRYARDGMRDESLAYARKAYVPKPELFPGPRMSSSERAQQIATKEIKPVRIELYPGEPPVLGDGRHRMVAAMEAGAKDIRANVVRYDAEGSMLEQGERLVSLAGLGPDAPPPGLKLSELWDLRKKLDESINFEVAQRGPAKQALMDMRSAFVAELDDTIARAAETSGMDPKLLDAWKKATEDYGDFALVEKGLKGLIKQRGKNRAISPTDYAAGGLMTLLSGGNPLAGAATGAASAVVHKLIRERGLGVMARIADRSGGVASKMEMAGKVAAMVESPKRLALPAAVNVGEQFDRYSQALTAAKADPAQFAERMSTATADLVLRAPELAQQVQATMMGDMAYLDKLHPLPATRQGTTLTPQAKLPQFYAYNQKQAFVDAAMALDNPMGVFEDIARGELPLNKLEALKERRPLLFNEMRSTVVKYTMTREEELPFSRRVLLGTAFSFPADWSMLHVGAIQESLVAGDASGKPNDPTAAPSKIGTDPGQAISPGQF